MEKFYVGVTAEIKEGKVYFNIDTTKGITLKEIQSVLAGGLNLTIKGVGSPEDQFKTYKEIVRHMESELFNDESFKDAHIGIS